jgi:CheY-like chemotaxis protein
MAAPAILYIEDDPLSREVLKILVTNVVGTTQLEIWEDSAGLGEKLPQLSFLPSVIFVDIHMKPLDGFAALKVIRQHVPLQNIPVIALTASVMNEEVVMLRQAGFNGAVAKPLNMDTFPDTLQQIMEGKSVWRIS